MAGSIAQIRIPDMNRLVTLARADIESGKLPGKNRPDLKELRQSALERLIEHGFPDNRSEAFRYSRCKRLENMTFTQIPAEKGDLSERLKSCIARIRVPHASTMVFIDGAYHAEWSDPPDESGLFCQSMRTCLESPDAARLSFETEANDHGWIQANLACFSDGLVLIAEAGFAMAGPLQMIHVSTHAERPVYLRHHIRMGAGSQIQMMASSLDLASMPTLINTFSDIQLEEDASLVLLWLDEDEQTLSNHWVRHQVNVGMGADYRQHTFHLGGNLLRHETRIQLEKHSTCRAEGLFMTRENQESDHQLLIVHQEAEAGSLVRYHGLADQSSRGVFQGRIVVTPGADKTHADMQSKNLLISDNAEIDAMPQLEIHADDVKCAHGVSIGKLDEHAIFYLESRGVARTEAIRMLMAGFANTMAEGISDPHLRGHIQKRLANHLQFAPESFGLVS